MKNDNFEMSRRGALGLMGSAAAAAALPVNARSGSVPDDATGTWYVTTQGKPWRAHAVPQLGSLSSSPFDQDAQIQLDAPRQIIRGFGGAFGEKGWQALSTLRPGVREQALQALFGDDGCHLSFCRTPIGANDISRGWYSYDEFAGDFPLDHFSIANDRETLIPYISAAQTIRPDLKLWASPWSPPTWMKRTGHYAQTPAWPGQPDNGIKPEQLGREGTDSFIQEDRYFDAYARYFRRYVEEYAKAGIRIDTVMPQNEFNSAQPFPSCTWTPEGLARFIPYLGREMEKVGTDLFFGTLERGNADLFSKVMASPEAAKAIKGIGVQWAGKAALPILRERFPDIELWGSEQECGVFGQSDWHYARYGWSLIKRYFEHGATVWDYWNMVMPEGGMSGWGWPQNSLVVIDTKTGRFRLSEDYWLIRHLASFVRPGARFVPVTSLIGFEDQLAFRNPDGSLVLVANNMVARPQMVRYGIAGKSLSLNLPGDSLSTIVLPASAQG